ncbi:GNAT family N-acetyltransferase [Clostridium sp. YIM B02515]|uniref:GNAT family N-acetyltransferase n=1 Tax=Clostridium rhizosphaerae TaxID=2803861 RepID=A0ABS1T492_9CLOT|nr:GNAT family N-acetyltransferase [Clostridium rhizosphaerae]MBL4934141.1 GNAT family N-acetyltransferase [Clostridium rhizosphaerae]
MDNITISRPNTEEAELINEFFKIVLIDTFKRNGIEDLADTLAEEIKDKRKCLNEDIESNGRDRYFLIAKDNDKIVGSIEYGPSNDLIYSCTNGELKDLVEIGTVFVHPDYQNKEIGSKMLNEIFQRLREEGIEEFCFDSGYKKAQKTWSKMFGSPEYHLKDFWGKGADHMVWRIKVQDVLK